MQRILLILLLSGFGWPCGAQVLTYSGTLTDPAGQAAGWPHLRFSLRDAEGEVVWSAEVDADQLALTDPDGTGRFVAVLDHGLFADGREGPPTALVGRVARSLSVATCEVLPCVDPPVLGEPQMLGSVPHALHATHAAQVEPAAVRSVVYQVDDLVVSQDPGPGEFANLAEALAHLDGKTIPPGRVVSIHIRRGVHDHPGPVTLRRRDGLDLAIVGEGPDTSILRFPSSSGLIVEAGSQLGLLDGVTIQGGWEADDPDEPGEHGVVVQSGSFARLSPAVVIEGFGESCLAVTGGHAIASGITVRTCGVMGVRNRRGGVVDTSGASISDAGSYCIHAAWGASTNCDFCVVSGCADGAVAVYHSEVSFNEGQYDDGIRRYVVRAQYVSFINALGVERPIEERIRINDTSGVRW